MNLSHRLCFFPRRGLFRWGEAGILTLFFWFIGGSENMTWFWSWQRGREEDMQRLALLVLLCIYVLAAVANRSQLKCSIDVMIGLLADTSVLISSSASLRQSSRVKWRAWSFVLFSSLFLVVEMTLMFDKLLKPQTLHVLQTRRRPVQVVCIHVKLQHRCSCNTTRGSWSDTEVGGHSCPSLSDTVYCHSYCACSYDSSIHAQYNLELIFYCILLNKHRY